MVFKRVGDVIQPFIHLWLDGILLLLCFWNRWNRSLGWKKNRNLTEFALGAINPGGRSLLHYRG
jgi:hypothetical protein